MAWFALLAPYLSAGAGAIGAVGTAQGGAENAGLLRDQAATTLSQGYADEATQRREATLLLGKQAAAAAQAGGGYGGTTALYMKGSAAAAEIDALNIRYRSVMRSRGLLAEGDATQRGSQLLAGGQLLSAVGSFASARASAKT